MANPQGVAIMKLTVGSVTTDLGQALDTATAWIRTKALDLDKEELTKFLDKLQYSVTGRINQTALVAEIYGSDDEDGPFVLLDTIPIYQEDPGYTDPPGQRWYKVRFIDIGVKERWRLHGFQLWGTLGGEEF